MVLLAITWGSLLFILANLSMANDVNKKLNISDNRELFYAVDRAFQLSGIKIIGREQQCIDKNRPWDCGEYSYNVILDYIDSESVICGSVPMFSVLTGVSIEGECFLAFQSINSQIVSEGWALTANSIFAPYREEMFFAQKHQLGVFKGGFLPPDDWYPALYSQSKECGVCTARHRQFFSNKKTRKKTLNLESNN